MKRLFLLVWIATVGCADSPVGPSRAPLPDVPPDLAEVTFTAEGRLSVPYVLVSILHETGYRGFVAIDGEGRPVWYFRTAGTPYGTTRRANGHLVLMDADRGLVEVTGDGLVVNELPQEDRPGRVMHHDVIATPDDRILFIAADARPSPDTLVIGDAVWEWDPETDQTRRLWSTFDHLDPQLDRSDRSVATDWVHANSLSLGTGGSVLVSMHFLDQVVAISPDFASLRWRMGGVRATVMTDDPFSGQHTATELEPGRVLLFDNGFAREEERYSRAAEYVIEGNEASLVWEWRPDPDNWARIISSAWRLPNGNTLVGFGMGANTALGTTGPVEVFEVTRDGAVVWHVTIGGQVDRMFRATPLGEF